MTLLPPPPPPETFPGIRDHFKNVIPVVLVGMTKKGDDHLIGEFQAGVVMVGQTITDMLSREIICILNTGTGKWRLTKPPRYEFDFIHIHIKEADR